MRPPTVRAASALRILLTARTRLTVRSGATVAHALGRSFVPPIFTDGHRILQEAITNAVVHSGGRVVHVQGRVLANDVAVDVVDDGRGLATSDLDQARRSGHTGLASMRRRAEGTAARLSIEPSPEGDTVVRMRWRA